MQKLKTNLNAETNYLEKAPVLSTQRKSESKIKLLLPGSCFSISSGSSTKYPSSLKTFFGIWFFLHRRMCRSLGSKSLTELELELELREIQKKSGDG